MSLLTPQEEAAIAALAEMFPGTEVLEVYFHTPPAVAVEEANRNETVFALEPLARDAGWPSVRLSQVERVLPGEEAWWAFLSNARLDQLEMALARFK